MSHACCHHSVQKRRTDGLFATLFKLMLAYAALVWGGGLLIHSSHPVAVEAGRLLHVVTFVDPAIRWSDSNGWEYLASGLKLLSDGAPITAML